MRFLLAIPGLFWASAAAAQQEMMGLPEALIDGQHEGVDQAMMWLALTAVAMVGALWAVHYSIFRR